MRIFYVAADIAKSSFDGAYWADRSLNLGKYPNQAEGYEAFGQAVERQRAEQGAEQVHLVLEPTSGYELGLALYAYAQGWLVSKPDPWKLHQWAKGAGYRVKTDPVDARMLAEYGARMQPPAQALLAEEVRELDYLLRRLDELDKLIRMEENRLDIAQDKPDMSPLVVADLEQTIALLQQQRAALEKQVNAHVRRHPDLKKRKRQLLAIHGIGPKTVLPLLVLLYRFEALTNGQGNKKKLTAFVGLDSQIRQSGSSVRGDPAISKKGDGQLRARLYLCALGGVRGHNALRDFYQRLVSRGKPKKKALVAAARKILHWAWAVFSSEQDFDPARAATGSR